MKTHLLSLITATVLAPAALYAQEAKTGSGSQSSGNTGGDQSSAAAGSVAGGGGGGGTAGSKEEVEAKIAQLKVEHARRIAEAKQNLPTGGGGGGGGSHSESKVSSGKSGSSTSTTTTSSNGVTTTITRATGPDGKERIAVTTVRAGGKPNVRELTPEEFEKEFGGKSGGKKSGLPAAPDAVKPGPKKPEEKPAPAIPLPSTQPAQPAATE